VHRRRRVTPYSATIPMRPMGYGGVGPSPALPLLPDTHGIASSRRLVSVTHGARNAPRQGCSATSLADPAGSLTCRGVRHTFWRLTIWRSGASGAPTLRRPDLDGRRLLSGSWSGRVSSPPSRFARHDRAHPDGDAVPGFLFSFPPPARGPVVRRPSFHRPSEGM